MPDTTTPTVEPVAPVVTEQTNDNAKLAELRARVKNGESLSSAEVVLLKTRSTAVADKVIAVLDAGGKAPELKAIGLTDNLIVEVMSVYNVKTDTQKYDSEVAINAIEADSLLVGEFLLYLKAKAIEAPNLQPLFNSMRSNQAVYAGLRTWNATRVK